MIYQILWANKKETIQTKKMQKNKFHQLGLLKIYLKIQKINEKLKIKINEKYILNNLSKKPDTTEFLFPKIMNDNILQ